MDDGSFPIVTRELGRVSATGKNHGNWRGGNRVNKQNRVVMVYAPSHPRNHQGCVSEHTLIAERALGKPLPKGSVVHHLDGNPLNNEPSNLAILPSKGFHRFIHSRLAAFNATGDKHMRLCTMCGEWKHIKEYYTNSLGNYQPPCKKCEPARKKDRSHGR